MISKRIVESNKSFGSLLKRGCPLVYSHSERIKGRQEKTARRKIYIVKFTG